VIAIEYTREEVVPSIPLTRPVVDGGEPQVRNQGS
jgi:hypothetical protein